MASTSSSAPRFIRNFISRQRNLGMFLLVTLVLAVLPLILRNNYQISILVFIGLFAILTVGLSLLMGYAGQVSLGHAVFYGMGGYGAALLVLRAGFPAWAAIPCAALATGVIAYLIGIPLLRLRGNYLAMATLGLNIIFFLIVTNQTALTGGPNGLQGYGKLSLGPLIFRTDHQFYYLVWAVALIVLAVSLNIVNSRVGRALRAIHGSEVAAETLGVNTERFKVQVLVLSAVYASLAGSLHAFWIGIVSPGDFSITFSTELVVMVAVGGLASVWGAIFGAAAVAVLTEFLRNFLPRLLGGASGELQIVTFGVILMLIMIFMPEGLTSGTLIRLRTWRANPKKPGANRQEKKS